MKAAFELESSHVCGKRSAVKERSMKIALLEFEFSQSAPYSLLLVD